MEQVEDIHYPFSLNASQLAAVLPHRGEILFAHSLDVLSNKHFEGTAVWSNQLAALQGHFPNQPIVPGVYLVEAFAQLAGAGLLTGDPYTKSLKGEYTGMLASIRKTAFKYPVLPNQSVNYDIHCRQMGQLAVQVTGTALVENMLAAEMEILLVYATQQQREQLLSSSTHSSK